MTNRQLAKHYEIPLTPKEGKQTTGKDELEEIWIKTNDPVIERVIEIRSLTTNITNYIPNWEPRADGRVHTTWGYTSPTGQLDARLPNILNCSKHTPLGQRFRRMIEAPQGYVFLEFDKCLVPTHRVLTEELIWKEIGSLTVGEKLIAFDEEPVPILNQYYKQGVYGRRRFRPSIVEAVKVLKKPTVTIYTDKGKLQCSTDHMWLGRHGRSTNKTNWWKASQFGKGDTISYFSQPWDKDTSWEGGYIAGFLDGEGSIVGNRSCGVGFAQNLGPTLDHIIALLNAKGFEVYYGEREQIYNGKTLATCFITGYPFSSFRVLGMFNPIRLRPKLLSNYEGMTIWGKNTKPAIVQDVEESGVQEVIAVKTSTNTYIADGFYSHNCSFHVGTLGYRAKCPAYIRFSQLDPHSILTSYIMPKEWGKPIEMDMEDGEILERCKWIKKRCKEEKEKDPIHGIDLRQEVAKPTVLGNQLGLGPKKLWMGNKRSIHNLDHAKELQSTLNDIPGFEEVKKWKPYILDKAYDQTFLILEEWSRIQYFFDVFTWRYNKKIGQWEKKHGSDTEKVWAFEVQGTAFGMIQWELRKIERKGGCEEFNFVVPIHDSLMFMPEIGKVDRCIEMVLGVMNNPCGRLKNDATGEKGLRIGVEVAMGRNWGNWEEEGNPEGMKEIKV